MIDTDEALDQSRKIEDYRKLLQDEDYVMAAVQRIAHVLSEELLEEPRYGDQYERKRISPRRF